jgi:hypothetical protein
MFSVKYYSLMTYNLFNHHIICLPVLSYYIFLHLKVRNAVFIPDRAIASLALIYYVWRIESAIYGPCWRTIFCRLKFLDFIIISVPYRCSIIYSTNDPHGCPLFALRNTIQRGTGLLMIFIKHVGKALAKFTVEHFGVKMTPLISENDPLF